MAQPGPRRTLICCPAPHGGRLHAATLLVALFAGPVTAGEAFFRVTPEQLVLRGNFARAQALVTAVESDGQSATHGRDLTGSARFATSDASVFTVDSNGMLLAVGNGQAQLSVTVDGVHREQPVHVTGVEQRPDIRFVEHISPILTKAGCNMGACHASQHGKGGLVLSVFNFDPVKDYEMFTRDREQRRVDLIEPERSLILLKPTMQVAHGGGQRLSKTDVDYRILLAWLKRGAPRPAADAAHVVKLEVWPTARVAKVDEQQQLRVVASYSHGDVQDVTAWARFDSMDDGVVSVSRSGRVRVVGQGQAPVMVRFEGQAAISSFMIPFGPSPQLAGWTSNNVVDELAVAKFRELGIEPSPRCDDATFLRRAFLDAIGTIPSVEEATAFQQSTDASKRELLIDRLLGLTGNPELDNYQDAYAAYWTLKWSDLIRNTSKKLGEQGMWALHNWIRDSFRQNKPFDRFVRELVTGQGSIYSNGPANYFRINANASELAESTSQLFLGIRLECAKCHHHPFEKYGQEDYYGFAAFFSRVGQKRSEEFGLFGREQVVYVQPTGEVSHPRTGKILRPTTLDGDVRDNPLDRRIGLAEWMTSPENEFFARSTVNRYVSYLLGRGLVDPVDDMRSTNPPSNVALLDALADQFVQSGFDLKKLIRTIMTSRLYQLDSTPTANNRADNRFYSHFLVKRIPAEPLLDAIDRVTSSPTKFQKLPPGTRAIELPDAEYPNYFLNTFAKPLRASVCECERSPDENLSQALHTLNGDVLADKIGDSQGRIATLLKEHRPHDEIVEQLYLVTLGRYPRDAEREASRKHLAESVSPREYYEDLMWALVNSKQFLFVH